MNEVHAIVHGTDVVPTTTTPSHPTGIDEQQLAAALIAAQVEPAQIAEFVTTGVLDPEKLQNAAMDGTFSAPALILLVEAGAIDVAQMWGIVPSKKFTAAAIHEMMTAGLLDPMIVLNAIYAGELPTPTLAALGVQDIVLQAALDGNLTEEGFRRAVEAQVLTLDSDMVWDKLQTGSIAPAGIFMFVAVGLISLGRIHDAVLIGEFGVTALVQLHAAGVLDRVALHRDFLGEEFSGDAAAYIVLAGVIDTAAVYGAQLAQNIPPRGDVYMIAPEDLMDVDPQSVNPQSAETAEADTETGDASSPDGVQTSPARDGEPQQRQLAVLIPLRDGSIALDTCRRDEVVHRQ
jgi:hypothetical protein